MTKTFRDPLKVTTLSEQEIISKSIEYMQRESRIFRLYPALLDIVFTRVVLPTEIVNTLSILIDKKLKPIYNLIDIHHKLSRNYYKSYLKISVESQIYDNILDEYRMILQIKKYVASEEVIEGKYLWYSLSSSELELIEYPIERLIEAHLATLKPLVMAYRENTNEWFKKYWETAQESVNKENEIYILSQLNNINPYLKKAHVYSNQCKSNNQKPTVSGLARNLKEARSTLVDKLGPELLKKIQLMFGESNSIKD